ncbi:hypothetical protein [Candidatus Chordibacter forsetii]|uniref:hypothetical protein n=1 Tax=Candidatus Chordibacter forsetii TaxID=3381758 RepID=UPI003899C8EE
MQIIILKPGRLIHHLSLDAALVAIVWKTFVSVGLNNKFFFEETLILGTAVWLAYSADRFFEPTDNNKISPSRFLIGRAHPIRFVVGWVLVLIAIIIYSMSTLGIFILSVGFCLFFLALSNFLICLIEGKRKLEYFPKEIRTSFILGLGCIFWEFGRADSFSVCMGWIYICFAFTLNCLTLKEFEIRNEDEGAVCSFISHHATLRRQLSKFFYGAWSCYLFVGWILGEIYPPFFCVSVLLPILLLLLRKWQLRGDKFRVHLETTFWVLPLVAILLYIL